MKYLNSRFQCKKGVSAIAHFEDTPKPIFSEVTNLKNLKIGRNRSEIELIDENVINDNWRFWRFVDGGRQELLGACVE